MKGVRYTKAEAAWLRWCVDREVKVAVENSDLQGVRLGERILDKMTAAETAEGGLNVGPLEHALVGAARGKVVPTTPGGYARASRQARAVGATVDAMGEIGRWLSVQKWLTEPVTILTVLNKWPEWYPRARAVAAPKGVPEGLGGVQAADVRRGPEGGSGPAKAGRPPAGFR